MTALPHDTQAALAKLRDGASARWPFVVAFAFYLGTVALYVARGLGAL